MAIRLCAKCGRVIPDRGIAFGGRFYHKACFVCSYCESPLSDNAVTYRNALYHPECNPASGLTVCAYCRKPITDSGYILQDKHYHRLCYHQYIEKQCCICHQPIQSRYYYDHWGQYAHTEHNGQKPSFCYSCGRIIVDNGFAMGVGASLCQVCAPTAVTTDAAVEESRRKVLAVFKDLKITGIPETIPVKLVPYEDMKGNAGCIHYYCVRDPNRANFHIHMTYGMQELHFRGVLAHEMLHSWLALYGREVTNDECEGFCNLGEAFVYTKENTPLANYLLKRMYKNPNIVYGDGYRLQKDRYERLGWEGLLNSLRYKK